MAKLITDQSVLVQAIKRRSRLGVPSRRRAARLPHGLKRRRRLFSAPVRTRPIRPSRVSRLRLSSQFRLEVRPPLQGALMSEGVPRMFPGMCFAPLRSLRRSPLQILTVLAVVCAGAAAAAPLSQPEARASVAAAVQQAVTTVAPEPAAEPQRVWEGADIDGDGHADFANPTGQEMRGHDKLRRGRVRRLARRRPAPPLRASTSRPTPARTSRPRSAATSPRSATPTPATRA
jgi:hypothetical protein